MPTALLLFYILSAITLGTAFLAIYSRNPIHSAIWLVLCFFSIAGHYLLLNAQFLALVHIIVYSGAIMILFLFTVMLMNLNKEDEVHKPRVTRLVAVILFALMLGSLVLIFSQNQTVSDVYSTTGEDYQSIKVLGYVLLSENDGFMVPFEFASVLLLVGMIGAVLLSKKEKTTTK
ncbi:MULTISPECIES: NADH-quinone oxidoreductase subunit J [unclassified Flavobacterium]|uniref:NADH-quinone oxidoreductase subunit J family protein n=1 Tax=unclassified Flavobacterium TaxID=196869 RepID=UPI001F14216C|nr:MULTISPECIES: NADH-quinone oxidoreductase subunit J [unclassified Flavobacterium]UMY65971.1 NADH-quinone oxidoreductase subunit J [Flavobacterium sp. HJ-32-4]HLN95501.1 NADH-quinone oxidoreductase subunit J [Flavobacterium sp.]